MLFDDLPAACGHTRFGSGRKPDRERVAAFVGTLEACLREIRNAYPALLKRARRDLARHLSLPGTQAELAAELRQRAGQLREAAVDPALKRFVVRASDEALGAEDLLTSLLTQLADKPPPEWSDADEEQFQVRLAHVARAFRGAESLLVASRKTPGAQALVRLSVARRGGPERERVLPLRAAGKARIEELRDQVLAAVRPQGSRATAANRDRALAALALAAESLLGDLQSERNVP